jgi:DNA-directed RNA polymerase specialized sigma24 family protein
MINGLDGNAADHAALLRLLVPLLRAFCRRRCGEDDFEDLVQETLIAVHTRRSTYDRDRPSPPGCSRSRATRWSITSAATAAINRSKGLEEILVAEGFEDASERADGRG